MKTITSVLIIVLLSLCHYVDRLQPKQEENLSLKNASDDFNFAEYEIDHLNADTIYYSQQNTNSIKMDKSIN